MARPPSEVITGNAPDEIKNHVAKQFTLLMDRGSGFADFITGRFRLTEVSLSETAEEPTKLEAKTVFEAVVEKDMLNAQKVLHGGCAGHIVDCSTTAAILAIGKASGGTGGPGMSLVINNVFHSPALLGDRLRIVSTSLMRTARTKSARCEIWNETRHRLVVSGMQVQMEPSAPPKL